MTNWKEQDAEEIIKSVNKYAKANMELKMKMAKDEVDEVLDELIKEVNTVNDHKNLISALGSKAMMPRHWTKVYAALETQAPSSLDMIQFNVLIDEYKAMDHADEIEDISGCAQGEH